MKFEQKRGFSQQHVFLCSFKFDMERKIKVFHVEDYKIMRDGIRHLLTLDPEIELVGEAKNGEEAVTALSKIEVDVLILDIYLDAMENL